VLLSCSAALSLEAQRALTPKRHIFGEASCCSYARSLRRPYLPPSHRWSPVRHITAQLQSTQCLPRRMRCPLQRTCRHRRMRCQPSQWCSRLPWLPATPPRRWSVLRSPAWLYGRDRHATSVRTTDPRLLNAIRTSTFAEHSEHETGCHLKRHHRPCSPVQINLLGRRHEPATTVRQE
jgi:hypothetical protein